MRRKGDDEEEDLGLLARQTLSGVETSELPPEPFAIGMDLARLATSRTSSMPAPPREDTDGRIDLRASSPGSMVAPVGAAVAPAPPVASRPSLALTGPAAHAARLSKAPIAPAPERSVFPGAPAPQLAIATQPLDELDAARAFSPAAGLATSAGQLLALARRAPSWTWVLVGGVGIGLTIGLVVAGGGDEAPALAPVALSAPAATPSTAPPVLPQIAGSSPFRAPQREPAARARRDYRPSRQHQPSGGDSAGAQAEPEEPPSTPPASADPSSIDSLLDRALIGSGGSLPTAKAAPAKSAASDLPSTPARADVARVLSELQPRIRFCAGERSGVATAQIVAKSSGRISSVRILGSPFSRTAAARCMESVIRGASLPPFSQSTFRVKYPYSI